MRDNVLSNVTINNVTKKITIFLLIIVAEILQAVIWSQRGRNHRIP
jgi:phage-related holin